MLFLDDGVPSPGLTVAEMERLARIPCRRVLRIERLAERLIEESTTFERFEDRLRERLLSEPAIALKSIVAYRAGLDVRVTPDRSAAARAFQARPARLSGHEIEDWLLHLAFDAAQARGLPVQIHTGWGDADLDLRLADPAWLTPVIRARPDVPIVLLHCYPFHRQAAYLAAVYPNVYVDLSLTFPHVHDRARILAETLELCPPTRLLYASDAIGIPEIFWLAAHFWRQALAGLPADVASLVLNGNARRLYDCPG